MSNEENNKAMEEFENQNPKLKEQFKIETGFNSIKFLDDQFPQWNSDYVTWLESKINKVVYDGKTLFEERNHLSKSNEKEINPNETEIETVKRILLFELNEKAHIENVEDVIYWALEYYSEKKDDTKGGVIAFCIKQAIDDECEKVKLLKIESQMDKDINDSLNK